MDAGGAVAVSSSMTEEELSLTVKWNGKENTVQVCGDDSVVILESSRYYHIFFGFPITTFPAIFFPGPALEGIESSLS
ncbi:hypothetical protein F3Y22_tig00111834pilonHSYRG00139 [Hibiscus syriacus]|uniref:Uncharacterized protein n=1 Tax=Hibiscus syriacus TaxID=106335 RepID=A0A6A2YCA6_HIBSY|nr:hypothetical protein F3Y22_tig00111834pilonHSYRG00139 [Hibiscus syriacus]